MRMRTLTMSGQRNQSRGFTLITTLILLFLLSGLAIGMLMMVNTEVKVGTQDVQNNVTFHAAEGGIEKMTSDLGNALNQTLAPTAAQIQNLAFVPGPPAIPGITFPNPGAAFPNGGYTLTPVTDAAGNIIFSQGTTSSGLNATLMNVQLQATAQGVLGDEVSMNRTVELALIPVFQFGIFCEGDCGFFAGPNFTFAGRVHANGDLYLAEGNGATLTLTSKVEAYGNIVRQVISNGNGIAGGNHAGTVLLPMVSGGCPGAYPSCGAMDPTEGSVVLGPTSAQTTGPPSWQTVSLSSPGTAALPDFNGFVIDGNNGAAGGTGAKRLSLPFVNGVNNNCLVGIACGPQNYEIIRRATGFDSATLSASRLYNLAQIRVLLSDNPDELPCGNPSAAPAVNCGSADAQNIRLANVNDGDNTFNSSNGIKQTAMPLLASGDFQSMYFATANSAIANPAPAFYSNAPASTQVSTDWEFGPLNPFPTWNIKGTAFSTNTITTAPGNTTGNALVAPYMLMDAAASKAAITKAPPQDFLVLCNPAGNATQTVTNTVNVQPATPVYCPDNGAYPYYSMAATVTGGAGYPPLTLPYPNPKSSAVITTSAATQSAWNLLDGYIRVEYRDAAGNYHPVTQEWLGLGFARNLTPPTVAGGDPISPTAILRLQQPANRDGNGGWDANGVAPSVTVNSVTALGCTKIVAGKCVQWSWTFKTTSTPGQPPEVVTDINTNSPWYGDYNPAQLSPSQYNWYPINFYDIREGEVRDGGGNPANQPPNTCTPNGVMNAVELDVGNLKRWLSGGIGASGGLVESQSQNGYLLYFSDRRGMLPNPNGTGLSAATAGTKTGDSGLEDVINSGSLAGTPNGASEALAFGKPFSPEDPNLNGFLDNWGAANLGLGLGYNLAQPQAPGTAYTAANNINEVVNSPANPDPYMTATANRISACGPTVQGNWVSGARHVLKVTDASLGNLPLKPGGGGGFSVGSENPVYVQGDYNSNAADPTWAGGADAAGEAASAVIADSVTFLSDGWSDWNSILKDPINQGNRVAATSYYRLAVAAGKNINFPYPNANYNNDFGTDGGVHNFLRYIENWGGQILNYKGSIANLFYSTYATGIFKCCNIVYSPPTRNYIFDNNFTTFQGLPPGTPTFRDIDNLSYRQSFTACNVGANGLCTN